MYTCTSGGVRLRTAGHHPVASEHPSSGPDASKWPRGRGGWDAHKRAPLIAAALHSPTRGSTTLGQQSMVVGRTVAARAGWAALIWITFGSFYANNVVSAVKLKFRDQECLSYTFNQYEYFYGSFVSLPDAYGIAAKYDLAVTAPRWAWAEGAWLGGWCGRRAGGGRRIAAHAPNVRQAPTTHCPRTPACHPVRSEIIAFLLFARRMASSLATGRSATLCPRCSIMAWHDMPPANQLASPLAGPRDCLLLYPQPPKESGRAGRGEACKLCGLPL